MKKDNICCNYKEKVHPGISAAAIAMLHEYPVIQAKVRDLFSGVGEGRCQDNDDFVTVRDVMDLMKVSRWTVSRLIKSGRLKSIKLSSSKSGKILIYRSSIKALIAAC